MFNFFKKTEQFASPISGQLIPLSEVNDKVFSQKMMGDGFAIIPTDDTICAPFSGTVSFCFPTKHAIGIKTIDGKEILIHIGIDTVELKGEGFQAFVAENNKIKQGDKMIKMDRNFIKEKGYDPTVIIVFPNNTVELNVQDKNVKAQQSLNIKIK